MPRAYFFLSCHTKTLLLQLFFGTQVRHTHTVNQSTSRFGAKKKN